MPKVYHNGRAFYYQEHEDLKALNNHKSNIRKNGAICVEKGMLLVYFYPPQGTERTEINEFERLYSTMSIKDIMKIIFKR